MELFFACSLCSFGVMLIVDPLPDRPRMDRLMGYCFVTIGVTTVIKGLLT